LFEDYDVSVQIIYTTVIQESSDNYW